MYLNMFFGAEMLPMEGSILWNKYHTARLPSLGSRCLLPSTLFVCSLGLVTI
jgi:hypothetical protein